MQPTEKQIQQTIINFLKYKGFFVLRLNSGRIPTSKGKMVNLAPKGTPDIMAFRNPRTCGCMKCDGVSLIFVEVKRKGNKPTFAQEQMMKELEFYGSRCLVAHSVEELEKLL